MAIENLNEIEKSLGIEEGKLSEMLSSEENHTIDLSNRVFLDQESFDTRIQNERKEAKTAGVEIAIKTARNELGLEFEGKTMENLLGAYKTKIESGFNKDASERELKLEQDLKAVQGNYTNLEADFNSYKSQITQKEEERKTDSLILKSMPENLSIPKEDALVLFKTRHKLSKNESGELEVSDLNGNVFKDETTRSALGLDSVLEKFASPYIKTADQKPKGRGEKSTHKQFSAGSFEAFDAEMKEKNVSQEQYNAEMNKRIQEGSLKL